MITALPISQLTPGDSLATSVYDAESKLLLREGDRLDESAIDLLKQRNLSHVDVVLDVERPLTLDKCAACRADIRLQLPTSIASPVRSWVCRGCGAIYFGGDRGPGSVLEHVDVMLTPMRKIALSQRMEREFSQSWSPNGRGSDRRKHPRYVVTVPVTVVPLDEDFRVVGESVQLMTQDISQGGICIKTTERIEARNLYVEFRLSGARLRHIVEVVRVRQHDAALEIGCRFVCRVVGDSAESQHLCSVRECGKVAEFDAYLFNIEFPHGTVYLARDQACPFLCRRHVVENEQLAQGERRPSSIVAYPYTNPLRKIGYTTYRPLEVTSIERG